VRVVGSEPLDSRRRDYLQQGLKERGIGSRVYYPLPLPLQPVYRGLGYRRGDLPNAELCAAQVLSSPCFPELTTCQQERVAAAIAEILSEKNLPVALVMVISNYTEAACRFQTSFSFGEGPGMKE
jgi:dTDP-4-amino-4,6-dideoxygalactose transaminase